MNRLNALGARARQLLAGFTPGQRGVVLVAVLALVLGTVALGRWAAQPSWTPLYTGLAGADASAIVEALKTQNVPYQLANDGSTIMVPQAQVYDLRVSLAGKGLSTSSQSNSWGVLDSQGMTSTEFQQNIAYQRALESELNKTLQAITGVKTAIVHLAMPKRDVFTTETDRPTASVLLALAPGTTLGKAQIRAVMRLVANSVPGLAASDVTVTDANGNMLSVAEDGRAGAATAASDADQQTQAFEDARSAKLQKQLDAVLGTGKSVARVSAELNFDDTETVSHSFLSQTVPPAAEATNSEGYVIGGGAAGGALGQTWPSLTPGVGIGGGAGTYAHVQVTRNNNVGDVTSKTKTAPGGIKRLSVAVVLDANAKGISAADIPRIQALVAENAGLDKKRGDTVKVDRLAFDTSAADAARKELKDAQAAEKTAQYVGLGEKAGLVLLAVIVAFLLMRRNRKKNEPEVVEAVASDLPPALGGPPPPALLGNTLDEQLAISASARDMLASKEEVLDPSLERQLLRDEVSKFVDQQPEEIALIVQSWLGQRKN